MLGKLRFRQLRVKANRGCTGKTRERERKREEERGRERKREEEKHSFGFVNGK